MVLSAAAAAAAGQEPAAVSGSPADILEMNNRAARLHQSGDYVRAEALYRTAIGLSSGSAASAGLWHNLGELLKSTGRFAESGQALDRALDIKRKTGGPADVALTTTSLADLERRRDRPDSAERLARQALSLLEKHPEASAQRAQARNVLGLALQALGKFADAEESLRLSAADWETHHGPGHPDIAVAWNNLGALYKAQGRYIDAIRLTKLAVAIWEKSIGPDHPRLSAALTNLADQYLQLGEYAKAETASRRAVAIVEGRYGPASPLLVQPLVALAEILRKRESPGEARAIYLRCLEIVAGQENRSDEATVRNSLGVLAYEQGDYEEAGEQLRRAALLFEQRLGAGHVEASIPRANLAAVYAAQKRYADAEPLLSRAVDVRRQALGEDHPLTAAAMAHHGEVLRMLGRRREGERVMARAKEILSRHAEDNLRHHTLNLPEALGLRPGPR